jgi:transposase
MEEEIMTTTIGIDIAKNIFHVHGVTAAGEPTLSRKLRRTQVLDFFRKLEPCLVGMEACATSHHWAREITALGHDVRLMPPQYVKPYVKRQKNDAADAAAICEAVERPNMRFVPVKSRDQQAVLMLHRSRDLLIRQRTMLINALRAHLAELGIVATFSSANEKNRCFRNRANIQRCATWTATSTFALSRGLRGRAGKIAVP